MDILSYITSMGAVTEEIASYYQLLATTMITNYNSDISLDTCPHVIIELALHLIKNLNERSNVEKEKQGEREVTYFESTDVGIPAYILAMIPAPVEEEEEEKIYKVKFRK